MEGFVYNFKGAINKFKYGWEENNLKGAIEESVK